MQENNSVSTPLTTPQVVVEQPKQSNFLTILLSVLLLLSVSIAGFFAYQTQKLVKELTLLRTEPTPIATVESTTEPVDTTDPTADWKTYTNTSLGFQLKYPQTFIIESEMNDQYNRATFFRNGGSVFQVVLRSTSGSLDKYYYMDNPIFTVSSLGGKSANVYTYDAKNTCISDGTGPGCPVSYVVYVAQNGSDFYHLGFFGDSKISDLENQILSTFKFTN